MMIMIKDANFDDKGQPGPSDDDDNDLSMQGLIKKMPILMMTMMMVMTMMVMMMMVMMTHLLCFLHC